MADELTDGRRFRTPTILDLFTRECLDIAVGRGLTGHDVAGALERLRFDRGLPQRIYCDNGSEFVSAAMDLWAYTNKVILDFSRRGSPTDNATIESCNQTVFDRSASMSNAVNHATKVAPSGSSAMRCAPAKSLNPTIP